MNSSTVRNIIMCVAFVIFLAMIIVGQRHISVSGLAMEVIGLIGLLTLLFVYNHRYKYKRICWNLRTDSGIFFLEELHSFF